MHHLDLLQESLVYFLTFITMQNATINSYELLDKQDIEYGQLKILQTSSNVSAENKGTPGKILHTLTGEVSDFVEVILLGVRKEFRVWTGDGISKYPAYLSNDMKVLLHLNTKTGEKIAEEPLEESEVWKNRMNNQNAKTQYYFLALTPEDSRPVFIRIGGLGFKRARSFLNQAQAKGKQLYEFITKISVEQENSRFGAKFVPLFTITDAPMPKEFQAEVITPVFLRFLEETRHPALPALPAGKQQ